MYERVLLIILDGWGLARNKALSAIERAKTPFIDSLYQKYPHSLLQASGEVVGLPKGQMGNSEVGHMHIGAGRIVPQELKGINEAINSKVLHRHDVLLKAIAYAKAHHCKVHLMGLVSDGGIHSHIDHLKALLSVLHQQHVDKVFVHAFTDGRDADPHSGKGFINDIQNCLQRTTGQIATVMGRYFSMDRDHRWERTRKAYNALVSGIGKHTHNLQQEIDNSYRRGISDEFIRPIIAVDREGVPIATIEEGDVVLFFNFRTDRGRQIMEALTQRAFPQQHMKPLALYNVTMTRYDDTFKNVNVIFEREKLQNTLGEVIARSGKRQIRIAETEKYPHVTFFFSGGHEIPYPGESRILCPSPPVSTYDLQPEMSAYTLKDKTLHELKQHSADFICLNFANSDMVGHTGVFDACVRACEVVDDCTGVITQTAKQNGYKVLIVADHGNADIMFNADRSPHTQHTLNPVPCILVDDHYRGELQDGSLKDIAPTILTLMGLAIPPEMNGKVLIEGMTLKK